MNDDNKIIEYEKEREWLRNSAWGQWWSSGNTETKTLTKNDVYILLAAYSTECVRVERERCAGIARKHGEGIGEHCWNHENLYVGEEIGAETTCWEEIATAIEREG